MLEFFSDLQFRALDVEAEVVDCGIAQGEEDGVHGEALESVQFNSYGPSIGVLLVQGGPSAGEPGLV